MFKWRNFQVEEKWLCKQGTKIKTKNISSTKGKEKKAANKQTLKSQVCIAKPFNWLKKKKFFKSAP